MNWVVGWRVRSALFFALVCLLISSVPASAQQPPETCKTGAYLSDLYKISQPNRSFDADLWFWSVCPSAERQPLRSMEYVNASAVTTSLDTNVQKGDVFWSNRKVVGTWRHDWNVRDFPFDRQTLRMVVEEGIDDSRSFLYAADVEGSSYSPRIAIPGWRITDFRLVPGLTYYPTSFGDPTLGPHEGSDFARLAVEVDIQRDGLLYFLKLTAIAYVAATLALLSFRIDPVVEFGTRFGLLAGALFATVLSMSSATNQLGIPEQLTLIDMIHIGGLLTIVGSAILTLVANHSATISGVDLTMVRRADQRYLLTCTAMFILYNFALIVDVFAVR